MKALISKLIESDELLVSLDVYEMVFNKLANVETDNFEQV